MKILHSYDDFPAVDSTIALTIGNFDGLHLGHQAILTRLRKAASFSVVFTFSNHPAEILHGSSPSRLTTLEHRIALFDRAKIDYLIVTPFTLNFSKKTSREFLLELKSVIPFSYLILGHDARLGHDRKSNLKELENQLNIQVEYLAPISLEGKIISSSAIRKAIQMGAVHEASLFLGRKYSIMAYVQPGYGKGRKLGFYTANLPVEKLTLPPFGVYAVEVRHGKEILPAVANLGRAPTTHRNRPVCLEVHLMDDHRELYGQSLEVFFIQFLRKEKEFETLEDLKLQITTDIACAKEIFSPRAGAVKT
jgi:riboflavin kinase / FMN adenylyltransferase